MKSTDDCVEIALASDLNFNPGLLVTAASMARYAARNVKLRFHILDGGIDFAELITVLNREHPNVEVEKHAIDVHMFDGYPSWRHGARMVYARLLLPKLLAEVEHVIYCDVDFLWTADVAELWRLRRSDIIFQSTVDDSEEGVAEELRWFEANGISLKKERYFCTGLCFINLELFRHEDVLQKCYDFMHKYPTFRCVDQTVLNGVMSSYQNVIMLPRKWQVFTRSATSSEVLEGCALHFAGESPWMCLPMVRLLTNAGIFWFRMYASFRKLSTWRVMRLHYSASRILVARILYLVFGSCAIMRNIAMLLLLLSGKKGSISIYRKFLHPVKFPVVFSRHPQL